MTTPSKVYHGSISSGYNVLLIRPKISEKLESACDYHFPRTLHLADVDHNCKNMHRLCIMKTRPCNILRLFKAVKMIIFR